MGRYKIGEHISGRDDTSSIFNRRFVGEGIPVANTFHSIVYQRLGRETPNGDVWCAEEARFAHSPQHDFRVKDVQGYIWGLPAIVPTCPKKLFALGPRKKYVDIVTDTLHASSSDLLTWNTLVMTKLGWMSLEEWKERDAKPPFLPDNRRGYARVTPVALSRNGIPGLPVHALDQYPRDGLGIYDDLETSSQFSRYVWSDWNTKTVQPMHIDEALRATIDQPAARSSASTVMTSSHCNAQLDPSTDARNKGSNVSSFSASFS